MSNVVITGIGIISGLGVGNEEHWARWLEAGSKNCDSSHETYLPYKDIDSSIYIKRQIPRTLGRMSRYAIAASKLALQDAEIGENYPNIDKSGVILGSILGCMDEQISFFKSIYQQGPLSANPMAYSNATPNAPAGQVAIELGWKGLNLSLAGDSVSGMDAVGMGYELIKENVHKELLLVGGYEGFSPLLFQVWSLSKRTEDTLSEGIALLCLEQKEKALRRKTKIYAEISGYTSRLCRNNEMKEQRVIEETMEKAGLKIGQIIDIMFCVCEGSRSKYFHKEELLKSIFGKRVELINISDHFGFWGAASGSWAVALAALSLSRNLVWENVIVTSWGHDDNCAVLILRKKGGEKVYE